MSVTRCPECDFDEYAEGVDWVKCDDCVERDEVSADEESMFAAHAEEAKDE